MEIEEQDELVLRISEDGGATASLSFYLAPSPFTDFFKEAVLFEDVENYIRALEESLRTSFSAHGFEIDNIRALIMFDSGVRIKVTLDVSGPVRWTENGWRLDFAWIDPEAVAEEELGEEEVERLLFLGLAHDLGYGDAEFRQSYTTRVRLPRAAENVVLADERRLQRIHYGGRSYSVSTIALKRDNGFWVLEENGLKSVSASDEFKITPEELAENVVPLSLTFSAPPPLRWSFEDSIEPLRLDLKFGRELRENYPVVENGEIYWMTPAQILYNLALRLLSENAALDPSPIAPPENEAGDWRTAWRVLSRPEYLRLAESVVSEISGSLRAPGALESPHGPLRFRDALYLFLRVFRRAENAGLPENVLIAPVPSGRLRWGEVELPARYAYYLLPDPYVITGTELVENVLAGLPPGLDNRGLAEAIADWTSSALSYSPEYSPPTSEQVILRRRGQCRDYTNAYLALARTAGLPARRVVGWVRSNQTPPAGWGFSSTVLPSGERVALHAWVEVYIPGEGWIPLDPQYPGARAGDLPNPPYEQFRQSWFSALAGYETARGLL